MRHRQTKGAETDRPILPPPRHIPTLPIPAFRCALQAPCWKTVGGYLQTYLGLPEHDRFAPETGHQHRADEEQKPPAAPEPLAPTHCNRLQSSDPSTKKVRFLLLITLPRCGLIAILCQSLGKSSALDAVISILPKMLSVLDF